MKSRLVREVMTKDVVTVRTYTSFRLVASAMLGHDVGAVPVVDASGHPVGMVSRTDLLAKRAHVGHGPLGSVCASYSHANEYINETCCVKVPQAQPEPI